MFYFSLDLLLQLQNQLDRFRSVSGMKTRSAGSDLLPEIVFGTKAQASEHNGGPFSTRASSGSGLRIAPEPEYDRETSQGDIRSLWWCSGLRHTQHKHQAHIPLGATRSASPPHTLRERLLTPQRSELSAHSLQED